MKRFILCSESKRRMSVTLQTWGTLSSPAGVGAALLCSALLCSALLCSLGIAFSRKPEKKQLLLPGLSSHDLSDWCLASVSKPRWCTVMVLWESEQQQCALKCLRRCGCVRGTKHSTEHRCFGGLSTVQHHWCSGRWVNCLGSASHL